MNRITLIKNARNAWKFYSMHAMLTGAALSFVSVWIASQHYQSATASVIVNILAGIAMVCGMIGRIIKQDPDDTERIANLENKP